MTPERANKIKRVLNARQPDLTVLLDEVHKGRNLAAIVRSCDATGIGTVHSVIPQDGYRAFKRTASGSHQWVDVVKHSTAEQAVATLHEQGFQLVAAHPSDTSIDYREVDYTKPTAVVMGAELEGVSNTLLEKADKHITVPMVGMVASLNVSVATAIILAEAYNQRYKAGLYQQVRLAEEEYQRLFFKWAYPRFATFCEQKKVAYPSVDEAGYIVETPQWRQTINQAQLLSTYKL